VSFGILCTASIFVWNTSVASRFTKLWGIVPHSTEKCGGHTFTLQYDVPKRIYLFYVQAFLTAIVRSKTEVEKLKY
jgi:hypothetical protein